MAIVTKAFRVISKQLYNGDLFAYGNDYYQMPDAQRQS